MSFQNNDPKELVPIGGLKINRVIYGEPEEIDITDADGKKTGSYYKCSVSYRNESTGEEGGLCLKAPKQFCYGFQEDYGYGKAETEENFKGYQFTYYCSDPSSKENKMTEEEKSFTKNLTALEKKLSQHLKDYAEFLPEKAGGLAQDEKLVSAIAKHPKKEENVLGKDGRPLLKKDGKPMTKKVFDKTKPLRMYVKLLFTKKTKKFATEVFGPGDIKMSPLEFVKKWGHIDPAFKFEYVYIGEASATFQIRLWECNYTPKEGSVRPRLLPPNTDPLPADVPETSDPNDILGGDSPTSPKTTPTTTPNPSPKTTKTKVSVKPKTKVAVKPKTKVVTKKPPPPVEDEPLLEDDE